MNTYVSRSSENPKPHGFVLRTISRVFFMFANSDAEADSWVDAINGSINQKKPAGSNSATTTSHQTPPSQTTRDERAQKRMTKGSVKVKASYDFEPQHNDELHLKEGDIVEVLEQRDDGWWRGQVGGRVGLFPANYVTECPG
eukprot:TRINITY_DN21887_c0_g1_i1.p1 TRINITY_DN21887_c0_g1~~TRINITY_DN21887_c0_g1_i1.p1  ORF type:complete len:156 (+),score=17.22 TRINITY_DN21887_c0_g1_i1:44-469(+)